MWFLIWLSCKPAPSIEGSCALSDDNTLRASCRFEVDPPSPLSLTLSAADDRLDRSSSSASTHEIALRRMRPETRYAWTARAGDAELSGEIETGSLPASALLAVTQTGERPTGDTMFVADCGSATALALDPEGQVVWYQDLGAGLPGEEHASNSLTLTEDGTIMAIVDRALIREFSLDGDLLAELPYGDGETTVLHHDAFRRDGRTYALTAHIERVDDIDYIVDGVTAFEADGSSLFDWSLGELAEVGGPSGIGAVYWTVFWPGKRDWAHANGLFVDANGDVIVSTHSFSTLLLLDGDPSSPTAGQPLWTLSGIGEGPFGSDLQLSDPSDITGDDTFAHQHHPSLFDDGRLRIFDNGDALSDAARVLEMGLDLDRGVAEISGSYPLGVPCPIEGSAFERAEGRLVASCAPRATFYEIDAASASVIGSTEARCAAGGFDFVPRAIPVDLLEEP